ncbi:MAG: hypothetical protein J7K51_01250 [Thermotogae bacterium]|nr:hypothetical protein [Thermotogota bacterium]
MFISFVLIQVKRTKEKINRTISFHTTHTRNRRDMTSVLSDGTKFHNVIHLWRIGQV